MIPDAGKQTNKIDWGNNLKNIGWFQRIIQFGSSKQLSIVFTLL